MLVTAGEKVSAYRHRANLARMRAVACVAAVFVQWLLHEATRRRIISVNTLMQNYVVHHAVTSCVCVLSTSIARTNVVHWQRRD